jgi:hypothetical protein
MLHSDLSVGCNAFMVFLSAAANATAFRSRIGRARLDELEWEHVFEVFRTGLPGRVNARSWLFRLDEVVRLLNADWRIQNAEFQCISGDQLQATARPFNHTYIWRPSRIYFAAMHTRRTKGHFFRPVASTI